jgi:hypothetical protein
MLDKVEEIDATERGFDLTLNPFLLLGVEASGTAQEIHRAYEDAVERRTETNIGQLQRAQQALLTPRLRINAEVGGLLNVPPDEVAKIVEQLKLGADWEVINDLTSALPPLPRSNALAHLAAHSLARPQQLLCLIESQASVTADSVYDAIIKARAQSGIGKVADRQVVAHALARLEEQQAKAAVDRLAEEESYADLFTAFVRRVLRTDNSAIIGKLDGYVRAYGNTVASELSRRREKVVAASGTISASPTNASETADQLIEAVREWSEIAEPLQMYEAHLLRDDPHTRDIYEHIRTLCIRLNDRHKQYEVARKITLACAEIFKSLPRAVAQMQAHAEIYAKNLGAQTSNAKIRIDMEASFSARNWSKALTLIEQLLAVNADPSDGDALRKMRDICRQNLSPARTYGDEQYEAKVKLSNVGAQFPGPKIGLSAADQSAIEAAQKAYRAARGRKEEVGAPKNCHETLDTSAQEDSSATTETQRSARGQLTLKHSRVGIASFVAAILVLIGVCFLFAFAALLQIFGPTTPQGNSIARAMEVTVISIWLLAIVAVVVGIVGVVNRNSKRIFSVLGLAVGGLVLVVSVPIGIAGNNSKVQKLAAGPQLPPNTSLRFTNVSVGSNVDSAGHLQGTDFRGPKTSLVAYVSFTNAAVGSDTIVFTLLSSHGTRISCNPQILQYGSGNIWCKWPDVGVESYTIEIRVNQSIVQKIPVHVM